MLDMHGICASSGSACTSGSLDPSHVLMSIGLPLGLPTAPCASLSGIRTPRKSWIILLDVLPKVVSRLRSMSPLWKRSRRKTADSP